MKLSGKSVLALTVGVLLVAGAAVGIAIGTGDDDETPITGDALAKASAAALQYTGGGRVTDSEVGDEEGYYEVEVTLADGTEVDVHLDQNFNVISSDKDSDDSEDNDDER
jgi:uncharacterized membrane protein YkoI